MLISKQGEVKVVDFGLAKATSQVETTDLDLALLGDEHVGRRDVAVDDAQRRARLRVEQLVRVGEALADLEDDVEAVAIGTRR